MFFLGVDIGSLYTKLVVINSEFEVIYSDIFRTMARNNRRDEIISKIYSDYNISNTCSTGYGRKLLKTADIIKTELYCASAGITQISPIEKTIIDIGGEDFNSTSNKELNSFCTVFAKTEIMKWIFDDTSDEDLAKGIFISIANRIQKIPADNSLPVFLIGGVAEYHPFLKNVIEEKFNIQVTIPPNPQLINAFGAACIALKQFN